MEILKKPNLKVKAYGMLLMGLLWASFGRSQNITSGTAIILPIAPATTYTASGTVNIVSGVSVTLLPGTVLPAGSIVNIYIDPAQATQTVPSNPAADLNLNWVMTRSYDENGNEIGSSKAFFDNNGKAIQAQSKSETTQQVLASQTIYDLQGRAALTTLAAPTNNSAFAYNANFVGNSTGAPYDYTNFDYNTTFNSSLPYSKTGSPDAVNNSTQGTLGWYYSNNNTSEPMVAATGYPFSRTDFYHDGTGAGKRSAGIGEQLTMGTGHEVTSNSFPVQHELDNYILIRNQFFPSSTAVLGANPTNMAGEALQSVSTDQNGTSAVSITDLSGKMGLMTGRADPSANPWLSITNTLNLTNVMPGYSFTVNTDNGTTSNGGSSGSTQPNNITNFTINSSNTVIVTCITCDVPVTYTGTGNNFVFPIPGGAGVGYDYSITSAYPFTVTATTNSGSSSTPILIYDQAEATFQEPPTTAIQYFQLATPSVVNITGNYTLYNMSSTTEPLMTFTSGSTLSAGYYKVVATAPTTTNTTNNVTVSYTNQYSDISYNYYNQLGQLIANIAPNGVQKLITSGLGASQDPNTLPFVTLYSYDLQGRLISSKSTDEGTSNFVYRTDGKIRFSQNSFQANAANAGSGNIERFSYTNYDNLGRPVESGEYAVNGTTAIFITLAINTTLLDNTGTAANVTGCTKLNNINTYYDVPNLNLTGYLQDPGFLKGAVSYTTNTVSGAINSSTWYNYDDHGRVTWVVKQIPALTGTNSYKTINYTYNAQGNVTTVAYQQGAADQFYHYYSYDADGRLINVQTSTNGTSMQQQAKYYYYLHGPLKRIELGNQLQGIDYVYTAQGWLKAINTPTGNVANDPAKDGLATSFAPDAFGMQLEYFPNDYVRTGSNVTNIPTGTTNYYNGNVSGMSWQSNKTTTAVSANPSIQNPTMYTYTYDPKYQFTNATWGTPAFGSSPGFAASTNNIFNEKVTGYDANGNIQALQRTDGNGGTPTDNFTYNYAGSTNQLTSVTNSGNSTSGLPYGTYTYDEIGRLKSQANTKDLTYLKYDVTGKIIGIYLDAQFQNPKVTYAYDESGNRIASTNYVSQVPAATTYYVYDVNGSVLAIYYQKGAVTPVLTEVPVYGSGRLGTYYAAPRNNYVYELRDNVGTVRVAIMGTKGSNNQASIYTYGDYYPYGSIAQSGNTGGGYRYGYQGAYAEKDSVTGYNNFELRMYDGRIGRWLSVDPAGQYASPYEGMGNSPVAGSDPNGGECCWIVQDGTAPVFTTATNISDGQDLSGSFGSGAVALNSAIVTMTDGSRLMLNEDGTQTMLTDPASLRAQNDLLSITPAFRAGINLPELHFAENVGELIANLAVPEGEAVELFKAAPEAIETAVEAAPRIIEKIEQQGFRSFTAFKRAFGKAGVGNAWHHIVEQTPGNVAKFGVEAIHNPENLMVLEHGAGSIHAKISGYYSSILPFTGGLTVRAWLAPQTFEQQFKYGIEKLMELGWHP